MSMPRIARIGLLLFLSLWAAASHAQQTQEQLAAHYYANGEFSQAAELYEGMYKRAPNKYYYQMLFRSYMELKQWKDAERLAERRLRQFPKELDLYVDMGRIQERRGEHKKAAKSYDAAVDKIGYDSKQIGDLCQAFETANHPEYAIKTYLAARKKMKNEFIYVAELANMRP